MRTKKAGTAALWKTGGEVYILSQLSIQVLIRMDIGFYVAISDCPYIEMPMWNP